jgi:hypothetical protein
MSSYPDIIGDIGNFIKKYCPRNVLHGRVEFFLGDCEKKKLQGGKHWDVIEDSLIQMYNSLNSILERKRPTSGDLTENNLIIKDVYTLRQLEKILNTGMDDVRDKTKAYIATNHPELKKKDNCRGEEEYNLERIYEEEDLIDSEFVWGSELSSEGYGKAGKSQRSISRREADDVRSWASSLFERGLLGLKISDLEVSDTTISDLNTSNIEIPDRKVFNNDRQIRNGLFSLVVEIMNTAAQSGRGIHMNEIVEQLLIELKGLLPENILNENKEKTLNYARELQKELEGSTSQLWSYNHDRSIKMSRTYLETVVGNKMFLYSEGEQLTGNNVQFLIGMILREYLKKQERNSNIELPDKDDVVEEIVLQLKTKKKIDVTDGEVAKCWDSYQEDQTNKNKNR